jgi:nitrate reductase alpha subunit
MLKYHVYSREGAAMTTGTRTHGASATDGPLADALLNMGRFVRPGETSDDLRSVFLQGGRSGDSFYRDRWSHDKVVRSTHGVNCTGSCSWKVYVKDGIITWEAQQTDYPSVGPDSPEYEPRGCPRGAAFSWYTYSPTRVRYPYIRDTLAQLYRAAKAQHPDPVDAWASIVEDPEKARAYKRVRGKGGLVRTSWDEVMEIAAAAHVHTVKTYGPDRIAGFSPIPAMSMVSHGAGSRFMNLIGGTMLSFYDWYADLPAGVRRPDRRARVGGLVERRLPDHVGLERAGHPHARRALHDRGPLPRPESHHGIAGLHRQHQVRR